MQDEEAEAEAENDAKEGTDEQEEGVGHDNDEGGNSATPDTPTTPLGGNAKHNDDDQQRGWAPHDEQRHTIEQSQLALLFSLLFKSHCMYLDTNPRKARPFLGKHIYFTRIFV